MKRKKERMRETGAIREIANVKWEIRRKKISKVFMNIKSRPKQRERLRSEVNALSCVCVQTKTCTGIY